MCVGSAVMKRLLSTIYQLPYVYCDAAEATILDSFFSCLFLCFYFLKCGLGDFTLIICVCFGVGPLDAFLCMYIFFFVREYVLLCLFIIVLFIFCY